MCDEDITIGNPQTCTIDNVLVSYEVTVDTITGLGFEPFGIANDLENHRMYVTHFFDTAVSVINLC